MAILALAFACLLQAAAAQTAISSNASATSTQPAVSTTFNYSLEEYWRFLIGPVAVAAVTTTVSPTPVPSTELIPPPPLYYSPFPIGQQVPAPTRNASWCFPKDFWWGVASAAYQVEGAVKAEGRGPSIWDAFAHRVRGVIYTGDTGDVADNQYFLYKQDIARLAAIGVPYYSFSISWSRIFPFGRGQINEEGLAHYDDVIATCLEYNVQPVVTLFHWDLPLYIQNLYGGWLGEEIINDFTAYAGVVFRRYNGKVKHWFTINEPVGFCYEYPLPPGFFTPTDIPPLQQPYVCGQHLLLAHASAYRLAKRLNITGTVSFKNNGGFKIPLTNSTEDALAVQRAWDFNEGWWADPIFLTGDYPASLKAFVSSFLPPLTDVQKAMINGSSDVFAHDAYTSSFYYAPDQGVESCADNTSDPLYPRCFLSNNSYSAADGGWDIGPAADYPGANWLYKATDWVPAFLHYIQDTWHPVGGIAITEFGWAEQHEASLTLLGSIRMDAVRSQYYRDYMQAILMAMSEGVNVVGCMAWSILDNLEWYSGYSVKYGLQYVNFTTQERAYKASFFYYVDVFNTYQEK